jgi:hypothetical protein
MSTKPTQLTDFDRARLQNIADQIVNLCHPDGGLSLAAQKILRDCGTVLYHKISLVDASLATEIQVSDEQSDREIWVPIMRIVLSEIAAGRFTFPYAWDSGLTPALLIRTSHIMDHISRSPMLREKWARRLIKSDRSLKKIMCKAEVITGSCERTIDHKRISHLQIIPLEKLADFGLNVEEIKHFQP